MKTARLKRRRVPQGQRQGSAAAPHRYVKQKLERRRCNQPNRMDEELPTTMEQALARARAEASELRRMVEVQEAAMATAAARQQRNGDAVAYAATLERWRQEVFAGAVRRRIHADQGVHLHAARRAAADAIRTAALCERRWRAAQAHAAAADAARRESEELLGRERRGVIQVCQNAFDAMRRDAERRETTLVRTASRLDEHAARLRKASDRVACAAELVRQREVRVRNARAALAAEKRLWRRERRDAETKALAESGVEVKAPPPDALVGLRPEAEALMRGIFRDLDADATGAVPAAALRKALRGDDRLDRLMRNYCGPDAWADCLDALDRRLTSLSAKPWGVADCASEADRPFASTEDVTWGEVLLFFVPGPPPDASGVHLAARGSLRSASSIDFRPRLLLDAPASPLSEQGLDALTPPQLRQEVNRLTGDRGALLRALALADRDAARHRDDAALLWRHELRLRSLRADAAQRDAVSMKAERDAARAETRAARDRAAAAVEDARTNAARAEARGAAQLQEVRNDLLEVREAMTRDVDAARRAAREADDARAAAAFEKDRALEALRRRERDAEAQVRALEAQGEARAAERKRDERRRRREVSKLRRERAALLALARSRDRPQPSRRQLRAAPRLAELRALALGLLSDESTEEGASSSAGDGADASSASSLGSGES